jgi:hypothetical protein
MFIFVAKTDDFLDKIFVQNKEAETGENAGYWR